MKDGLSLSVYDIYDNNKDKILTGLSVVGIFASLAVTIIGTRKGMKKANKEGLNGKEEFKKTWYYYLPGFLLTLLSSAGMIFAHIEAEKKATALVIEYVALRSMMDNVKDEITNKYGDEVANDIFKKSKQPGINSTYTGLEVEDNDIYDKNGPNVVKFVDDYAGTEFYAQPEFMRMSRESLNQWYAFNHGFATFEDWYNLLMEDLPTDFYDISGCKEPVWDVTLTDILWIGIHYRLKEDSATGELYYSVEYEFEPVDASDYGNACEKIPEGWCGE